MVPAKDPQVANTCADAYYSPNCTTCNDEKPFITTYQTNRGDNGNSVWILKEVDNESGYYYMIHAMTGKYLVYEPPFSNYNNRKSFHLQTQSDLVLDDNAKFEITSVPTTVNAWSANQRLIRIKKIGTGNRYLNPAGDQTNNYHATGGGSPNNYLGLVGIYSEYDGTGNNVGRRNTRWYLESTLMTAPIISNVSASNTITITDANGLSKGYTIRYTTDGSDPTATTPTIYSDPINVEGNWTVKAVVERYGIVLTHMASQEVSPVIIAPTVTNNFDGTISLSTATTGATIYYTTNGDTPNNTSTEYSSAFSLGDATVIKAIAYLGSDYSEVTTYNVPHYTTPTISFNSSTSLVTITSGGTAYYNTGDGSQANPTTSSTAYSAPFSVTSPTTVKAIATHAGYLASDAATLAITQVATPTIQNNGSNAISITCATTDATIYYTTDGSTPTTSSTEYTGPLTENVSGVTIKAIAVKENMITSEVGSGSVMLTCSKPTIVQLGKHVAITCSFPTEATIRYTTDGSTPGSSSTAYPGTPVDISALTLPITIKAYVSASGYTDSEVETLSISSFGNGTAADPYIIGSDKDFKDFISDVNADPDKAAACYKIQNDIDATGSSAITRAFTGTLEGAAKADGTSYTISNLKHALFNTINGGTVKNVMLKDVDITSSADAVGAIAGTAKGYSRIYNCGILPNKADFPDGTNSHPCVSTTGNCAGGLVGSLEDDSRVINCFSYADIKAATTASGIVGQNTFASNASVTNGKYANLRTAVVNCMFYGNITGGDNQYGVYGGSLITNANATGISSYNYYRNGTTFTTTTGEPTAYNCSFPAEERYLTQVEFHRSLLNSNRELCGWWVGSDIAPRTLTTDEVQAIAKDASLIYKWVLDSEIAPYPILKPFDKYASVVNNPGNQTGSTLKVDVKSGSYSSAADQTLYIPITNMDPLHHDYGYYKVQLPYFNTVFGNPDGVTWAEKYAGNYTEHVVTGWKVNEVTTDGTIKEYNDFVADWQDGYNFADRKCTEKDLYNKSRRVFAQGGYYYVPDGVTGITIEAYWGKAIYVRNAQASYDRVNITAGNTGYHFDPAGTRDNNVNNATIQTTSIKDALTATNINEKKTVYDYALVLVGNVQESVGNVDIVHETDNTRGFTIMSADFDFDEEPDFCLEWQLGLNMARQVISPIRFDFLPVVELGIAGKLHNSTNFFSLGCYRSKGHFEVTETAFIHFGQFEFELQTRDEGPVILNGGIFDQYCRGRNNETNQHINYVILGGHIVMPSFTPGAHVAQKLSTRHCAVNALGGDFTSFYLTGGFREDVEPFDDNPHCYIDGGRFGTIAAAYKEGIKGNVTWRINHALIDEFYGGGVMSQDTGNDYKIVKGNIDVVIDNSTVGKYCGGPKFGDMVPGKTVTTSATNTVFTQYFGAGNGGTNYIQYDKTDDSNGGPYSESQWSSTVSNKYTPGKYKSKIMGYEGKYELEVINTSTGNQSGRVVNRSYYYSAQFATTNTGDVTNSLTDCTIETNFYGGGFLGGVNGKVTSTLTDTRVYGSVYGAGYSASAGTVTIYENDITPPVANIYTSMIKPQSGGTSNTYYWTNDYGSTSSPATAASEATNNIAYFYTEVPLNNLGTVSGLVTLTISGTSEKGSKIGTVGDTSTGNVFGGGEMSAVYNSSTPANASTIVNLQGKTEVLGNVFGGGNEGLVSGSTTVNIREAEESTNP